MTCHREWMTESDIEKSRTVPHRCNLVLYHESPCRCICGEWLDEATATYRWRSLDGRTLSETLDDMRNDERN